MWFRLASLPGTFGSRGLLSKSEPWLATIWSPFARLTAPDMGRSIWSGCFWKGDFEKQEIGRWANNRVGNSHLPFRRRERTMLRFRQMKSLQKFASVHANVHNHFSLERQIVDRQTFKQRRSAALAEWKSLVS